MRALADAAQRLFREKGYAEVSVQEIAGVVDISVPTVFVHVPDGKEAIMFDDGVERRQALLAAVHERPAGQSLISVLREFMARRGPFMANPTPDFLRRTELIMSAPALRDFTRTLWMRCEAPLAEVLDTAFGRPPADPISRSLARYVLEIPQIVSDEADPRAALEAILDLLEHGLESVRAAEQYPASGPGRTCRDRQQPKAGTVRIREHPWKTKNPSSPALSQGPEGF